ncbi:MAG: xanthine dehydrogenase accessory protein XdhC [Steroidobacteraceae bacterium]
MSGWLRELRELGSAGRNCLRVTVMDVRGSAPREIGATMLVTADDLTGSIGGGQLEYQCTQIACEQLSASRRTDPTPFVRTFPLGAAMGQCCGGVVDVLFEPVPAEGADWLAEAWRCYTARVPAVLVTSVGSDGAISRALLSEAEHADEAVSDAARRILGGSACALCVKAGDMRTLLEPLMEGGFTVALFGAGHVGSAVVHVLANLDCRVRWIDSRRDVFPRAVSANVTCIESAEPAREVHAIPSDAFFLVMTYSHAMDYAICEQILARDDFAYCGLIGSRSKRRRFEKRLRAQGMAEARIERLTCPIGIAGLSGKKPGEIAVAVAAELLQRRQTQAARTATAAAGKVRAIRP